MGNPQHTAKTVESLQERSEGFPAEEPAERETRSRQAMERVGHLEEQCTSLFDSSSSSRDSDIAGQKPMAEPKNDQIGNGQSIQGEANSEPLGDGESGRNRAGQQALETLAEENRKLRCEIETLNAHCNELRKHAEENRKLRCEIEMLNAHCNELVKQQGMRQLWNPSEDESQVIKRFRELKTAIQYWCYDAWEIKPPGTVTFKCFPLGRSERALEISTEDVFVLISCIWEWLVKAVFGKMDEHFCDTVDLWTDYETAGDLKALETRVSSFQGNQVLQEWRSFTVQCLLRRNGDCDQNRIGALIAKIIDWLQGIFRCDASMLRESLGTDVVIPAVKLHALLRQRPSLVYIHLPITVEKAVHKYRSQNTAKKTPLEITLLPALIKVEYSGASETDRRDTILMETQMQTITLFDEKRSERSRGRRQGDGLLRRSSSYPPSSYKQPSSIHTQAARPQDMTGAIPTQPVMGTDDIRHDLAFLSTRAEPSHAMEQADTNNMNRKRAGDHLNSGSPQGSKSSCY